MITFVTIQTDTLLLSLCARRTFVCGSKVETWLTEVCFDGLCLILCPGTKEKDYRVIRPLVEGMSLCDHQEAVSQCHGTLTLLWVKKQFKKAQMLYESWLFTYDFCLWFHYYCMNTLTPSTASVSGPCRETYSTIKMLVLNIDKMYLFWQYNIYYCMHTVGRAVLKNDSVCIRKGHLDRWSCTSWTSCALLKPCIIFLCTGDLICIHFLDKKRDMILWREKWAWYFVTTITNWWDRKGIFVTGSDRALPGLTFHKLSSYCVRA